MDQASACKAEIADFGIRVPKCAALHDYKSKNTRRGIVALFDKIPPHLASSDELINTIQADIAPNFLRGAGDRGVGEG